jgi:hypothetical protein
MSSYYTEGCESTLLQSLRVAAGWYGFNCIIPLTKLWAPTSLLTVGNTWDDRPQEEGELAAVMPSYGLHADLYEKMWFDFPKELRDPFSDMTIISAIKE